MPLGMLFDNLAVPGVPTSEGGYGACAARAAPSLIAVGTVREDALKVRSCVRNC